MSQDDTDLYELAPQPVVPLPAPKPATAPAAVPLNYRRAGPTGKHSRPGADSEILRNVYLPIGLLAGGVVIEVAAVFLFLRDAEAALKSVAVQLGFGTVIITAAVLFAARVRQIDLGNKTSALYKAAALAVAPDAVVDLLWPLLMFLPLGGLLAWGLGIAAEFTLVGALFDLDQSDSWYCVCVIFLIRLGVYFAMLGLHLRA